MPRRETISIEQKKALRAFKASNQHLSNLALKDWFEATYQQVIARSSVSEILSARYQHLDQDVRRPPTQKRYRQEHWPHLESALYEWVQRAEGKIPISGEIIQKKAAFFWQNMGIYKDQAMPSFSNGWLQKFQARRSIKERVLHGEEGSVSIDAGKAMIAIRQTLASYEYRDIFNCDETGLFWKLIPDRSLSTRSLPGRKKEKARISLHFCCNADGSEKLQIWAIGNAKKPRAFRAAGINIENLNITWRANQKAWMTTVIMEEWLRWFDSKMRGRKVVLLMDNFKPHEIAVSSIEASTVQLQNTSIIWLPANSTSRFQPLDQGIIYTWKSHYKNSWLDYMLREYEAGRDPIQTTNILKSIRWAIQAWDLDIKASTITNCFKKGLWNESTLATPVDPVINEILNGFERLRIVSSISNLMDISFFINPKEELVDDEPEHLDEQILSQFEPADESDDDEVETVPPIPTQEALEALKKLQLYEEQQDQGDIDLIQWLNRHERVIWGRKMANLKQGDIRAYFAV
jgi:hypothetical protein